MVTDAEGNLGSALHLRDEASKGSSGRVIPLNKDLRSALQKLHDERDSSPFVITTERSQRTSAAAIVNLFAQWYGLRVSMAAQVTQDVAPSSPTQRGRFRLSEGLSGTFRCWLDIERSPPLSATSRRMWKHRKASWIWLDDAS